jgi:hypothetical protein
MRALSKKIVKLYFNKVNIKRVDTETHNVNNDKTKQTMLFEYMLGSTAMANEHRYKMMRLRAQTCWGKFKNCYKMVIATLIPFKGNMNVLFYRYDREVQVFFETMRYMIVISFVTMMIFLCYMIFQITQTDFNNKTNLLCKYNIPCFLLYSGIRGALNEVYSYSFATMICVVFFLALTRYINFSRLNLTSDLYDRENAKFSQTFFTSWDWSTKARYMYIDKKSRLRNLYRLGMKEADLHDGGGFNCNTKCGIYAIRVLSFFLTAVCMLIYGFVILFAYFLKNFLKGMNGYKPVPDAVDVIVNIFV